MRSYDDFKSNGSSRPATQNPHLRVVNAVLMQAADDLRNLRERLKTRRYPQQHMVEAAMWVDSDDIRPFSYRWCCDMVGRDPDVTRPKMLQCINVQRLKEAMQL